MPSNNIKIPKESEIKPLVDLNEDESVENKLKRA